MSDTSPTPSRIYALIIGINKYKHEKHKDLEGCVTDATAFMGYLTQDLGVSPDQIVCLLDKQATRQGILDAFESHLLSNLNINSSDTIVIYFAGHGARVTAPLEWHSSGGMCEMILPYDAGWSNMREDIENGTAPADREHFTHGIPDRTLGSLIYKLHRRIRGDNIVVILDSCFSASGTRATATIRNSEVRDTLPSATDSELVESSAFDMLPESQRLDGTKWAGGLAPRKSTHILLAACPCDKFAQEICTVTENGVKVPMGLFTFCLLQALRSCKLSNTSYLGLMNLAAKSMNIYAAQHPQQVSPQLPQCEGANRDRVLFQTKFALTRGMLRIFKRGVREYFIKAGSAVGVMVDTVFDVYSADMPPGSHSTVQLVAAHVRSTEAILRAIEPGQTVEIPPEAYARVAKFNDESNKVRVLVVDRHLFDPVWEEVFSKLDSLPIRIIWTQPDELSDLIIKPTQAGASLQSQPIFPHAQAATKILNSEDETLVETLTSILAGIVRFHFHLHRQNPKTTLRDLVGMQLFELEVSPSSSPFELPIYEPKKNAVDLFDGSLGTECAVQLQEDPTKQYGLMLTNNSGMELFPYVFYYDPQDYSITPIYISAGNTKTDNTAPDNTALENTTLETTISENTTPRDTTPENVTHENITLDNTGSDSATLNNTTSKKPVQKNTAPLSALFRGVPGRPGEGGMQIGYGSNGDPIHMKVPEGYKQDFGYFVMLVSSQWVDIEHVSQYSPFEAARKGEDKEPEGDLEFWDTVTVRLLLSKKEIV
ncbi:hypothetical protein BDV93DRAFT_563058 [Ceratobasidium sp. AG-I]|nr:hypothetical protein BDV93DRAFT_563058 [Ceratobasidium sp. AG-I]